MSKKKTIKSYKGFDKDLKCRGFQYEIGKEYETDEPKCCKSGFHACECPLDCLAYYTPNDSRYCEVEQSGKIDNISWDTKMSSTKIKIGAEIGLFGLIEASIKYIKERTITKTDSSVAYDRGVRTIRFNNGDRSVTCHNGDCGTAYNGGDCSVAYNDGYRSAAYNDGYYSLASNDGDNSVACNRGENSVACNKGNGSVAWNSGDYSVAFTSGVCSMAHNNGDNSVAYASGDNSEVYASGRRSIAYASGCRSDAYASGYKSAATVCGNASVACALGLNGKAKGKIGCWLVISEWALDDKKSWQRIDVQCAKVDGKVIKEDTYYVLKKGKFVEAQID